MCSSDLWIDRYFEHYPGVRRYMDETVQSARQRRYVQTFFGRRLYLPDINAASGPRRAAAERQAINAPMQGTAADLIKKAMIAVQAALAGRQSAIVMQVHDELVLEVPEAEAAWAREQVPRLIDRFRVTSEARSRGEGDFAGGGVDCPSAFAGNGQGGHRTVIRIQ